MEKTSKHIALEFCEKFQANYPTEKPLWQMMVELEKEIEDYAQRKVNGADTSHDKALNIAIVNASFLNYGEKPETYVQKQLLRTLKNIDHLNKYANKTKQIRKTEFHEYMRLIKEPLMRAFGVVFPEELH